VTKLLGANFDLLIALMLIIIVVILYMLARMKVLPRKSLPWVGLALLGVFGISWWKNICARKAREELEQEEANLRRLEKETEDIKEKLDVADMDLEASKAKLASQIEEAKRQILESEKRRAEEKKRIAALSGDELQDEFLKKIGS